MAMAQPQEPLRMTEAEYLEFEANSDSKHEFVDGEVYAMAGAQWEHALIVQSASAALYAQLRNSNCRIPNNDLRLKVASKKVSYRYPDFMVVCGDPNFVENRQIIDNPTLIVEVLSSSTALEDRNAKLHEYTALDSVQAYVLISQIEARVEVFSRHPSEADKWVYSSTVGLDRMVELAAIDCTLALADVYEQVTFDNADDDAVNTET